MKMYLRYFKYVIRHKWFVFIECCRFGIPWRGIVHDLSKLLPSEFVPYARYFEGDYPSFNEVKFLPPFASCCRTKEEIAYDFDVAWLHHQKRNRHHWQYWVLLNDDGDTKILEMPDRYRWEMLADWIGAGKALGTPDTKAWYLKWRDTIQLGRNTRVWIEWKLGVVQG